MRVKLAPKKKASPDQALKSPSLSDSAKRLIPTVPILLPFCAQHGRRTRIKQRFQLPLILCGFLVAVVGGIAFWNSHSIWPLPVSVAVMALLFFAAHHHQLGATEVSSRAITLAGVHELFANEFARLNTTLEPSPELDTGGVLLDAAEEFVFGLWEKQGSLTRQAVFWDANDEISMVAFPEAASRDEGLQQLRDSANQHSPKRMYFFCESTAQSPDGEQID